MYTFGRLVPLVILICTCLVAAHHTEADEGCNIGTAILGADIEAPGGVIGGGTPLGDAVAFGQWQAARRLVERGARTTLWEAAALGLMARVEERFIGEGSLGLPRASPPPAQAGAPTQHDLTHAFWWACHGGQRATAEYLLRRGADLNWVGYDGLAPIDAACRSEAKDLAEWLRSLGAKAARELR